ncbi:hypothetical protein D3P07_11510 [Paenibacillus sp. 1011MAR3C5]|uniref:hypothetical protein n=1 Tax=Paenibacillus sp. 1011MAR3C5 TaxID=1675787 RepID=UPI000E6BEABE|nr:hypothetical protein [Paenibacillus sp. 1011MAR3C5]RJE88615.1 hypothetical protein D3P07_11510 [Paenibacillus sp. 1011MAR3C5]
MFPYRRNGVKQLDHDMMISRIATGLKAGGFIVVADHIKWQDGVPPLINGHKPDIVYIERDGSPIIIEVETLDSCTNSHTINQLRAFNKQGETYVFIPTEKQSIFPKRTHLERIIAANRLSNVKVLTFAA